MLKDVVVGYRFSPTGEELINHYLKNKILGKTWLVDEAISEINFLSYIPELLPRLAKIQSDNLEWYFFSRIEYTNPKKKNAMKRSTGCGYWKPTGKDRKIKDKRGNGVEIGLKKTLVYHKGKVPNGDRTPWVIHEYHITCLPQDQRNYVICQVKYKGEDIPFGGTYSSEPSQSMVSDSNSIREAINSAPKFEQPGQENIFGMSMDDLKSPTNEQEDLSLWDVLHPDMLFSDNNNPTLLPHLAPNDDEFLGGLRHIDRDQVEYLFANEEFISTPTSYMQENRSDHRPKKPLSGIILDYSCDTDSDAESISATSYQGTSSPGGDRVGSSNSHSQTGFDDMISLSKALQTSHEPSISRKTRESQLKQEIKQDTSRASGAFIDKKSYMVKTEKKGWFITEEAMERNRNIPRYVYLVRMIIGFIILLALIGNIISVLTLKSD
ncbi:PREDICTED: NAC domain-containing protein 69-like [Camelina sativa]|uniref:NAC domain-containing protein 69-like n=1 Tax=Camelina sativa TaxID=90675 RepID=A0ABM0TMD1_CAMSA|nr:PREDICTED: NAC domain-containing protein 69-like [Camelina sativa]